MDEQTRRRRRASQFVLGVIVPTAFSTGIIIADSVEGQKTAFVGLLATSPLLAAVFGTVPMVLTVSIGTWLAAFTFGAVAADGNSTAQIVRLFFIASMGIIAVASAEVRIRRERQYVEARVHMAEAESMRRLATTDMMTGTLNRRGFFESVAVDRLHDAALAVIDVDGLKDINDQYGHSAGDAFLITLANRLQAQSRGQDIVARWGGDEFLMLIAAPAAEALSTLRRVVDNVSADPVLIEDRLLNIHLSAGLAPWPRDSSFDAVFQAADACMYRAKQGGGAQVLSSF